MFQWRRACHRAQWQEFVDEVEIFYPKFLRQSFVGTRGNQSDTGVAKAFYLSHRQGEESSGGGARACI